MKSFFFLVALANIVLGGLVWFAYLGGDPADVFDVPLVQARSQISRIDPLPRYMSIGVRDLDYRVDSSSDPMRVSWTLRRNHVDAMRFVATLTPVEDNKTKVAVDIQGLANQSSGGGYDFKDHPEIKNFFKVSLRESVASTLQRRDFDMNKINMVMAGVMLKNMQAIQNQIGASVDEDRKREGANVSRAYAEERARGY